MIENSSYTAPAISNPILVWARRKKSQGPHTIQLPRNPPQNPLPRHPHLHRPPPNPPNRIIDPLRLRAILLQHPAQLLDHGVHVRDIGLVACRCRQTRHQPGEATLDAA